jgi:ornithine carbamoyltransferase
MKKDFLSIADWTTDELLMLLELSREVKIYPANFVDALKGRSIATIFEKQSLRTHVTFDVGIHQLGAHAIYLTQADISLGKRESVYDTGKNLERWVDGIVVRTYAHKTCKDLAKAVCIPVVNALTDREHPCQALGDFLTIQEHLGSFKGKKFVYIGDGNNVCHSLMLFAGKHQARPLKKWEAPLKLFTIRVKRWRKRMLSTLTYGQAWARNPKRISGRLCLKIIR